MTECLHKNSVGGCSRGISDPSWCVTCLNPPPVPTKTHGTLRKPQRRTAASQSMEEAIAQSGLAAGMALSTKNVTTSRVGLYEFNGVLRAPLVISTTAKFTSRCGGHCGRQTKKGETMIYGIPQYWDIEVNAPNIHLRSDADKMIFVCKECRDIFEATMLYFTDANVREEKLNIDIDVGRKMAMACKGLTNITTVDIPMAVSFVLDTARTVQCNWELTMYRSRFDRKTGEDCP